MPVLKAWFPSLQWFILCFLVVAGPVGLLIGWLDKRFGTVPVENQMSAEANPWIRDVTLFLMGLTDDPEKKQLLEKWVV